MSFRSHYAVRFLLLVFYSIYALSPIYASGPACSADCRSDRQHAYSYSVGIVWVNVVMSSLLVDDEISGSVPAGEASVSQENTDLILIKKKRAVLREQHAVPPPSSVFSLLHVSADPHLELSRVTEVPQDLTHRKADGYRALHAGLSPPLHFS